MNRVPTRRLLLASLLVSAFAAPMLAHAQAKEIRIAHVYSKTGPLEARPRPASCSGSNTPRKAR